MSKLTTFRMPDDEAAAVAKECERREIGLTTAMMEAVRMWLAGRDERPLAFISTATGEIIHGVGSSRPATLVAMPRRKQTATETQPAHMAATVPILKRKAFNPQPKKR